MGNNKKPEHWIPDSETYNQLQKLKKYVDFVAGLEYSTIEDKTKAEKIKLLMVGMESYKVDLFSNQLKMS